jgi:hypothetical protein
MPRRNRWTCDISHCDTSSQRACVRQRGRRRSACEGSPTDRPVSRCHLGEERYDLFVARGLERRGRRRGLHRVRQWCFGDDHVEHDKADKSYMYA